MDVLMPQLGETVTEGKITRWFKSVGEAVARGDNLCEIETDKVTVEVPAIADGVLTRDQCRGRHGRARSGLSSRSWRTSPRKPRQRQPLAPPGSALACRASPARRAPTLLSERAGERTKRPRPVP